MKCAATASIMRSNGQRPASGSSREPMARRSCFRLRTMGPGCRPRRFRTCCAPGDALTSRLPATASVCRSHANCPSSTAAALRSDPRGSAACGPTSPCRKPNGAGEAMLLAAKTMPGRNEGAKFLCRYRRWTATGWRFYALACGRSNEVRQSARAGEKDPAVPPSHGGTTPLSWPCGERIAALAGSAGASREQSMHQSADRFRHARILMYSHDTLASGICAAAAPSPMRWSSASRVCRC